MTTTENIHIRCDRCGNCYPQDPFHEGYPGPHMCNGVGRTVSWFEQLAAAEPMMHQMMLTAATGLMGWRITAVTRSGQEHKGVVAVVSATATDRVIQVGLTTGESFDYTAVDTLVVHG